MHDGFNFHAALTAFALLVLLAARSEAQAIAENFDQLRFRLQAGDTVYIVDGTGQEQEARVLDLSSSLLAVSIDGTRRSLSEPDVTRIRRRLPDSLRNGAIIGAATGSGLGIGLYASLGDECSAGCWATGVAFYGGLGALVGTGVDALIKGRKTIYTAAGRDPSAKVVVRPLILPGVKSLSLSVHF
jgi:hypothetical protein